MKSLLGGREERERGVLEKMKESEYVEEEAFQKKKSRGEWSSDTTSLNFKNKHERDSEVVFFDEGHKYYVNGKEVRISVTGIKKFFIPDFDQEDAILSKFNNGKAAMVKGSDGIEDLRIISSKKKEDLNKNRFEMFQMWDGKTDFGSEIHAYIERFLINLQGENSASFSHQQKLDMFARFVPPDLMPLMEQFVTGLNVLESDGWYPYRAEWNIYCQEYKYAGGVDAVFERKNPNTGKLEHNIIDFKVTNKYMKQNIAKFHNTLFYPFHKFRGTNLNGYGLQFNLLRFPLKYEYGLNPTHLTLFQLDYSKVKFHLYECELMEAEVREAFKILQHDSDMQQNMIDAYRAYRNGTVSMETWRPVEPWPALRNPITLESDNRKACKEQSDPVHDEEEGHSKDSGSEPTTFAGELDVVEVKEDLVQVVENGATDGEQNDVNGDCVVVNQEQDLCD